MVSKKVKEWSGVAMIVIAALSTFVVGLILATKPSAGFIILAVCVLVISIFLVVVGHRWLFSSAKEIGKGNRIMVVIDCSENAISILEEIKAKTGVSSYADVIRKGVEIYFSILDYIRTGYRVLLVRDDNEEEVELHIQDIIP